MGLALALAVVPTDASIVERGFSTGVYPRIQRALTTASNVVPFALFDVLTLAAAVVFIAILVRGVRALRRERRWAAAGPPLRRIVVGAAAVYLVFLAFWGFNYRRIPMTERLVMERDRADAPAVAALGLEAVRRLDALHGVAHARGWRQPWRDDELRAAFGQVQQRLTDAPAAVPGRVKRSIYGPYFRWTSVDGMVNPFALEVLANPDLLPFEQPFVAAHEWAHLAGFADESEASFVGWLTCLRAGADAQYSGWLYLYWQVSGEVTAEERAMLWSALDAGPRRDVEAIVERLRRGQLPLLRNASWRVYDQYLRANRVDEGIRSYGEVVTLILRARFDEGWVPVRRASASSR